MPPPERPKIYHIIHVDRLTSVLDAGRLWCDARMADWAGAGTVIGMSDIKRRRLHELTLACHPELHVGDCVPFYFCPRSVMLYLLWHGNHPNLQYRGGQNPIVHLEADLRATVDCAELNALRWAFTLSNAGAYGFEARDSLASLHEINWAAVSALQWSGPGVPSSVRHGKQAEFLVEDQFPWVLVEHVGTRSRETAQRVTAVLSGCDHRPPVEIRTDWYYGV